MKMWNRRQRILIGLGFSVVFLAVICIWGSLSTEEARVTDFSRKNIAPCLEYIFGTDWLGRDMLARTLKGVVIGVALTHWPSLARLIRAEVIQLRESPYIQISRKLGKSSWYIARKHMLPHLVPQFIVGLALMFPHAILHESSITFLGFGLSTEQPAIGIVLSEAMQYLITGKWWLALFPGLLLVFTVVLFYIMGESLRKMLDPGSIHQ